MFNELTTIEQQEVNGGWLPAIPFVVKAVIAVAGTIFVAGSVKGCTNEAAKDK